MGCILTLNLGKALSVRTVDPSTLGAQELEDRGDVLHESQAAADGVGFVERDGFGGFLAIEECCVWIMGKCWVSGEVLVPIHVCKG